MSFTDDGLNPLIEINQENLSLPLENQIILL